jgi:hypothetical protein
MFRFTSEQDLLNMFAEQVAKESNCDDEEIIGILEKASKEPELVWLTEYAKKNGYHLIAKAQETRQQKLDNILAKKATDKKNANQEEKKHYSKGSTLFTYQEKPRLVLKERSIQPRYYNPNG